MAGARTSQRRLLTIGVCLLLAAAIAWALARRHAPDADAPATGAAAPLVAGDVAAGPPPGAVAAPPDAAGAPPEDSRVPHTRLPLRLLATVVHKKPSLSLATIEDVERTTHAVMNAGQSFEGRPSVRIARIERARVLLDNDGVREQLVIVPGSGLPDSAQTELTPEEREHRRDLSQRLRALTEAGTDYRGPGERGGLLAEGDVSGVYEDGELIGVQLEGIREGGVYDRFGLRNGDVVTGINGISLADSAAAAKVMAQFVASDELNVSVERGDGSLATLQISTEDFKTAVEALE